MGTELEDDGVPRAPGTAPRPGRTEEASGRLALPFRRRRILRFRFVLAVLASSLLLASYGCRQIEPIREYFREPTPHEAYRLGLSRSGLANTALGQDWIRAADRALSAAPEIEPPFREAGYLPPEEPSALGYAFELQRGQVLAVELTLDGIGGTLTFLDLYRAAPDSARPPVPVASADSAGRRLEHEASRDGRYVLRIQPELLRGGRYELEVRVGASLAFPVWGRDTDAILSFFGASREGGRRSHHGVDIFAPRNTPVLAATEGYVRVGTNRLGGNVIWLRDASRRRSLYYAHLEDQVVPDGTRVRPGDTIGLVGNSGNARTTSPHLHFGIYRRGEGPVNPWYFLHDPRQDPLELTVDPEQVGRWVRTTDSGIRLRTGPDRSAAVVAELERHTALRVVAAVGDWFRVRLPDGRRGFVAGRLTESAERPLRTRVAAAPTPVTSVPDAGAPVLELVDAGRNFDVLGSFDGFLYVRPAEGRPGWIGAE